MIKQIKRFFKHITLLDPQYSLNVAIVLLLSLVSFYTSFDGLRHYMFGNNTDDASWALLVLLAFLVFLIQLLLIVALMRLTQRISFGNKASMFMLYLIAMGFSVFLSYSYWYQAIQADNYAYNNFNVQLDESLSDVGVYQDTFTSIKKIATELAEYSQETALLEKNRGRTCGDNSSPGAGPRLSLRNSEENLFTLMNSNITLLNDEVMHKINKLDSIRYGYSPDANIQELQKAMNVVIAEVNRYKQNPDLIKAKKQLKEHSGQNRETLSTLHNGGGRTVSCPDAIITQKSQLLLERIGGLPVLKNIRLFNSQNHREVMTRALKVFLVIPKTVKNLIFSSSDITLDDEKKKDAEAVESSDFTPLILGVLIDLIIFFVGYGNGKYSQQRNYLSGKYHGQHFSVNDAININDHFYIDDLRENLQWYHHKAGRKHFIIIPSDAYRQSDNLNKRNLVSLMESLLTYHRISLFAWRIPFDRLPQNMCRRFSSLPKDTLFEYYQATEEQWFDLVKSLEANEILTSKRGDPRDFVISTFEHHEVKDDGSLSGLSSLSLREKGADKGGENDPAFKRKKKKIDNSKEGLEEKAEKKEGVNDKPFTEKSSKRKTENEVLEGSTTKKTEKKEKEEATKKDIFKDAISEDKAVSVMESKKETPEDITVKDKTVITTVEKENASKSAISKDKMASVNHPKEDVLKGGGKDKMVSVTEPKKKPSTDTNAKKTIVNSTGQKEEVSIKEPLKTKVSKENIDKDKESIIKNEEKQSKEEKIANIKDQEEKSQKRIRQLSPQHQRIMRKRGR